MRCNVNTAALLIALVTQVPDALAQLEWRVSLKFILNEQGIRPGETDPLADPDCESLPYSGISCDSEVVEKFDYANAVLGLLGRGYHFRVVEMLEVHGMEQFFDVQGCSGRNVLANWVDDHQEAALWNDDALNIYITNPAGGGCSVTGLPGSPPPLTLIGQGAAGTGIVRPLHEMGHALGLCHTHGGEVGVGGCSICDGPDFDGDCVILGDDCHGDTLPDNPGCDDDDNGTVTEPNDLSMRHFGRAYTDLDCSEQRQVLDVFYNVMSYHAEDESFNGVLQCPTGGLPVPCGVVPLPIVCRHRLTPDQLDRMTDRSNAFWPNITSGRTWFVDEGGGGGFPNGTSTEPYPTVAEGLASAESGDIVMVRGGNYDEALVIGDRVTLRASRGNALMGQ